MIMRVSAFLAAFAIAGAALAQKAEVFSDPAGAIRGYDPVAYMQANHANLTHLHLKDRKRDQGANTPWGTGDTKIKEVLALLKREKCPIRAYVEYEYQGTAGAVEEVKKCLDYSKAALA